MPTDIRARARHECERGRRHRPPATEPGEIPGQLDIYTALDHDDQDHEEHSDGQA